MKTLEDIYRCPQCQGIVAEGNAFCRSCGHNFSIDEIKSMRAKPHSTVGAAPWNTRDRYKCVHCSQFICINDQYCRCCGDFICDKEKQMMRANMKELANKNMPALIGCMGFVALVLSLLILANR